MFDRRPELTGDDQTSDTMASAQPQHSPDSPQNVLLSFAKAQLRNIDSHGIKKNSFQLFSITAFLFGALNQLGKQSHLNHSGIRESLHTILRDTFNLPAHNAEGLVNSICRMMDKYYLLENIYHDGESAAERWLTSENADCAELTSLLNHYQDFTMLDMSAAGLKSDSAKLPASTPASQPKNSTLSMILAAITLAGVAIALIYFL